MGIYEIKVGILGYDATITISASSIEEAEKYVKGMSISEILDKIRVGDNYSYISVQKRPANNDYSGR